MKQDIFNPLPRPDYYKKQQQENIFCLFFVNNQTYYCLKQKFTVGEAITVT